MKRLLIISLLLLPTLAQAQTTELTFKFTLTEAELILKGLRKLPVEDVEMTIAKVRQQAQDQLTPKPPVKENEQPKPKTKPQP